LVVGNCTIDFVLQPCCCALEAVELQETTSVELRYCNSSVRSQRACSVLRDQSCRSSFHEFEANATKEEGSTSLAINDLV
jgi:hypothetical protein